MPLILAVSRKSGFPSTRKSERWRMISTLAKYRLKTTKNGSRITGCARLSY